MKRSTVTATTGLAALLWTLTLPQMALSRELDIDIKGANIEQLMQISITTTSRYEEQLQGSAAAVFVLSRDDIRRSHVTSVPEALRLVPGVQVARIDANKWAISIRGFNSRTANKLLVLVDGRSIYDPLFAGVFWEARDVNLEEVERIEVVRGPGGTLWGANAVNGVINIITRHAGDTLGTQVTLGTGTEERAQAGARYGWKSSANGHVRIYADGFARDTGFSPTGAHDDARLARAGMRADWTRNNHKVLFKTDLYDGLFGSAASPTTPGSLPQNAGNQGQSLVLRWTYNYSEGSQTMLQFWYDRFSYDDYAIDEKRQTYDIEFQQAIRLRENQRIVWGANHRRTSDHIGNGPQLALVPTSRRDNLSSLFVQDEISLVAHRLRLTLGTKLEQNDYSGTEWQPNIRFAWLQDTNNTVWSAVSRAVRSPSRLESDISAPSEITGNPNFDSEKLVAYEAGYRSRVSVQTWIDTTVFYNAYRGLLSIEGTTLANKLRGSTSGVEIAGRWLIDSTLHYDIAYSYLNMDLAVEADSVDLTRPALVEGSDPRHQVVVRGAWNPWKTVEVDATLRYVDKLAALSVPSYLTADLGIGWRPQRNLRITAVGQNLLDRRHPEQSGARTTEVQRGLYLKLRWEL